MTKLEVVIKIQVFMYIVINYTFLCVVITLHGHGATDAKSQMQKCLPSYIRIPRSAVSGVTAQWKCLGTTATQPCKIKEQGRRVQMRNSHHHTAELQTIWH